jgi:hypothetical protein
MPIAGPQFVVKRKREVKVIEKITALGNAANCQRQDQKHGCAGHDDDWSQTLRQRQR